MTISYPLSSMAIAIDFGTSNTVISRWNSATQQAETVTLPGLSLVGGMNPPLIPSLVYVEDGSIDRVLIGQMVRDRGLDLQSDHRFFRGFKRGIGVEIQGFLPELDGVSMTFERVGELFLTEVIKQLQQSLPEVGESLVLTVPVDSFEVYRRWLSGVCETLPVDRIRLLDEPTAAALGYDMTAAETLLVVDFGGGTLDLSLVQLTKQVQQGKTPLGFLLKWGEKAVESSTQTPQLARVIAKAGQNLGGTDIDNWVAQDIALTQGLTTSALITRLAEKLKIQLSLQTTATEVYFDDRTFDSYEFNLTRDRFEEILKSHQFFDRLDESMIQVLQQARRQGIETNNIDGVLLVGGTVQIPAVQNWVRQYFDESKIRQSKPFEAIAHGALQLLQGIEIQDFLYHSYGVRYWDRRLTAHNWHPIIQQGQAYPMSEPVELTLGASRENQPSIELIIGELGATTGGTEVYFDGDRLITRCLTGGVKDVRALNDRDGARNIAKLEPAGYPGTDRIKVKFNVDRDRQLRITVEDLLTNQTLLVDRVVAELS
jgi:molecular chaperone DnaK (HSP70)